MPSHSSYHHGDLRGALITAAGRVLAAEGLPGLSLRAVAREAGVSHAAPYHHFDGKQDLIAALAIRGHESLRAALVDAWRSTRGGPLAELRAMGLAYIRHAAAQPHVFRLMLRPEWTGLDREAPGLRRAADSAFGELEACVRRAVDRGEASGDPRTIALTAWCSVHGLAVLWVDGTLDRDEHADLEPLARAVTDQMLAALRPSSNEPRN